MKVFFVGMAFGACPFLLGSWLAHISARYPEAEDGEMEEPEGVTDLADWAERRGSPPPGKAA